MRKLVKFDDVLIKSLRKAKGIISNARSLLSRKTFRNLTEAKYAVTYPFPPMTFSPASAADLNAKERALLPFKIAIDSYLEYKGIFNKTTIDEFIEEAEGLGAYSEDGWLHDKLASLAKSKGITATCREVLNIKQIIQAILDNQLPILSVGPSFEVSKEKKGRFVIVTGFKSSERQIREICVYDPLTDEYCIPIKLFEDNFSGRGIFFEEESLISWADVDLGAIKHNVAATKELVGQGTEIMAIVKAEAYGHGLIKVSKACRDAGIKAFGVATKEEGLRLRKEKIEGLILILYHVAISDLDEVISNELSVSVYDKDILPHISTVAGRVGKTAKVHIVVDTGMGWYGLKPEDVLDFAKYANDLPNIEIEGLYSHFSQADNENKEVSEKQLELFNRAISTLKKENIQPKYIHIANSAAIIDMPESHFNMVRPGIMLYGIYPKGIDKSKITLRPAFSYKTRIIQKRDLKKGSFVGYGGNWQAKRDSKIAVLPIGYSDGLSRIFSNNSEVIIRGKKAPIAGNICMNVTMVDVTDIDGVTDADVATIIGSQNGQRIGADELAERQNTISYEILTSIGMHVQRYYN